MLIFSISFHGMKFNLVVLKVCGQGSATSLSSYFRFSLNILQQYSQPICPVAVVPTPCLMVQQVFHKADRDFHLLLLHTTALTALLLPCHCRPSSCLQMDVSIALMALGECLGPQMMIGNRSLRGGHCVGAPLLLSHSLFVVKGL